MNSLCEHGFNHSHLLLGKIVPYLVQGLLFGGVPPFILYVTDIDVQSGEGNTGKYNFHLLKLIGFCYYLFY